MTVRPAFLHDVLTVSANAADRPAIIDAGTGRNLTYARLHEAAHRAAAELQRLGLRAGDRLGIFAAKSPEVVATFLGASLAGIVFVPLDRMASPGYVAGVLSDFGIATVVADAEGLDFGGADVRVVPLASLFEEPAGEEGLSPAGPAERSPHDPAYILTTSGSTGRPKGVVLSHENALAFSCWAADEVALSPADTVLSLAPFHFDLSVFDIYSTLERKATLVLPPATATLFPGQILEEIDGRGITTIYAVPSVLARLVETGGFDEPGAARSLRTIMYAGEPFPKPSLVRMMEALPHVAVFNFFGPTETNVSLAHRFSRPPQDAGDIPIGRPASGAVIRLLDEAGDPVPPGETGEIVVDGPTVMKGYLTASGFAPAARPLATGDFARLGADGSYYFRGRRDQQVKVRGNRVELLAVADALAKAAGTSEAAAFVVSGELVGFVATGADSDPSGLRVACRSLLPPTSIPDRVIVLPAFPRLTNGKIDRVALMQTAQNVTETAKAGLSLEIH